MSRSGTSNRRRLVGRRGATSVEMAMVGSAFLLLLLGSVEVGRYFFVSESLKYFVGELGRAIVVNPDENWSTAKETLLNKYPILKTAASTVSVTMNRQAAPALTTVTVSAAYPYAFNLRWLQGKNATITSDVRLSFVAP